MIKNSGVAIQIMVFSKSLFAQYTFLLPWSKIRIPYTEKNKLKHWGGKHALFFKLFFKSIRMHHCTN